MQINANFSRTLLLLLVLGWTTAVAAQQNYGIVSPNTKTNLKLADAIAGMNSAEESKLLKQAINLSCVVRSPIRAFRALGSWTDGAEHSVLLRVAGDEARLRYVLSRMGRDAEQKYVIYFHPQPKGSADLYVLRPRRGAGNLVALTNALERAGIPFRTLVPSGGTTAIYVIDLDRDLRVKIMIAARSLRARVSQQSGNAQLFGDDERPQAKVKFEQEIKSYETKNPNLPPTCDVQKSESKRALNEINQPLYHRDRNRSAPTLAATRWPTLRNYFSARQFAGRDLRAPRRRSTKTTHARRSLFCSRRYG